MDEETRLLDSEAGSLPAILKSDHLIAIAEAAEKRVDALKKIKLIALRMTNPKDWTDHQGKPWLQESGATKVARIFGISWKANGAPVREQLEDGHFQFTYTGEFTLADVTVEAIGSRQSRDGFYNMRHKWDDSKQKMVATELPPSEIDAGDVKKGAWANWLGRGITTILGIKNLTWEEIQEHTGITKDQVTQIQYRKGGKKSPEEAGKTEGGNGGELLSEKQMKAIFAVSKSHEYSDDDREKLCEMVSNKRTKKIKELTKAEAGKAIDFLNKPRESGAAA